MSHSIVKQYSDSNHNNYYNNYYELKKYFIILQFPSVVPSSAFINPNTGVHSNPNCFPLHDYT